MYVVIALYSSFKHNYAVSIKRSPTFQPTEMFAT